MRFPLSVGRCLRDVGATPLLVLGVSALVACDLPPPSVSFHDAGPHRPDADHSLDGGPADHIGFDLGDPEFATEAIYDPPSSFWTSPDTCLAYDDPGHCAECWSWTDSGADSLGRNALEDEFGAAVAVADFNGDGYPDLGVGAPGESVGATADAGLVYVYLGSATGFQPWLTLSDADIGGPITNGRFGATMHAVDLAQDGTADLFVGYGGSISDAPVAHFVGGPTGFALAASRRVSDLLASPSSSDRFGHAMASGDLDHDGELDLAISAPGYDSDAGRVLVFPGDGLGDFGYGYVLESTDDRDGEGLAVTSDDELVFATDGGVHVFDYTSSVSSFTSQISTPDFGTGGLAAGDLDGDGTDELLVASGGDYVEIAGATTSIDAPTLWHAANGPASLTRALAIEDFDLDGHADILIHNYLPSPPSGNPRHQVSFLEGDGSLSRACWLLEPSTTGCWHDIEPSAPKFEDGSGLGFAFADIDGDGWLDLASGAPLHWDSAPHGAVYAWRSDHPAPGGGSWTPWWEPGGPTPQVVTQETALTCDRCSVATPGTYCDSGFTGSEICVDDACVTRECGDGFRQPAAFPLGREACDDGNTDAGDACSGSCEPTLFAVSSRADSEDAPDALAPALAEDAEGNLLFVYAADTFAAGEPTRELRARRYDSRGNALEEDSAPLGLANGGVGWDPQLTVAGRASGHVALYRDPSGEGDVRFVLVDADGTVHPSVAVAEETRGMQSQPRAARLDEGFVVVWIDESGFAGPLGSGVVYARRFDDAGRPQEAPWPLSDPSQTSATQPAVASNGAAWMAAWAVTSDDPFEPPSLSARRFLDDVPIDATAIEIGVVGAAPSLAPLDDGFVAAWITRDPLDDPRGNISARGLSLDALNPFASDEFTLQALGDDAPQLAPTVAPTGLPGEFLVFFEQGGRRRGLAYGHVSPSSTPPAPELASILEPALTDGLQGDASLLATSRGLFFAFSDASGFGEPSAYRSFLAFLLPRD